MSQSTLPSFEEYGGGVPYMSSIDKFRAFLLQSAKSNRLCISTLKLSDSPTEVEEASCESLVILEELPNISSYKGVDEDRKASLHSAIDEYLAKGMGSAVLIVSSGTYP
jgi:hypothetical protein